MPEPKHPHPWLFALTGMPYGVVGAFSGNVMPYLTRRANLEVGEIGWYVTLLLLPPMLQFLYAPVVDIGPRRRSWLLITTGVGAAALVGACVMPLPDQLTLFLVLAFISQTISGLVGACNGGLLATSMPDQFRGKASAALNVGNLCGGGISASIAIYMTGHEFSPLLIGLVLAAMMVIPSLAVLYVVEPPREVRRRAREVFGATLGDVKSVLFSRKGITGILLCLSPVGTAALINYFSAIGVDYVRPETSWVAPLQNTIDAVDAIGWPQLWADTHGPGILAGNILTDLAVEERVSDVLAFTQGPLGVGLTAIGALVGGYLCDRTNRRAMYLLSGAMTAVVGIVMALSSRTELTFMLGALAYQLVTGFCYAAFTATVLETIGKGGKAASTQYTLFVASGNAAIAWVGLVDSRFHETRGVEGVVASDAALNIGGVIVLSIVFWLLGAFGRNRHDSDDSDTVGSPDSAEPASQR